MNDHAEPRSQSESRTAKVVNFHILCRKIMDATNDIKGSGNIPFARGYARTGLTMNDWEYAKGQIPYILNNLRGWKGEEARQTKKLLKELENV